MKKTLAVLTLIAALSANKAEAHPFMCAVPAGGALSVTMAFMGGMAAFATLPIAIVGPQDYHGWDSLFPVVTEDFPGDKHFGQPKVVVSNKSVTKRYQVATIYGDSIRSEGK